MVVKMLDQKTKDKVKSLLSDLNKKLFILEGKVSPEERKLLIDSIILNDEKGSILNQLEELLGIEE